MRLSKILLFFSFFSSCKHLKKDNEFYFNKAYLSANFKGNEGIIISCIRCDCITKFINSYSTYSKATAILADTNCVKLPTSKIAFISQAKIDSVFERNFNAILFKNLNNSKKFHYLILKTEDSERFSEIVNSFFYR